MSGPKKWCEIRLQCDPLAQRRNMWFVRRTILFHRWLETVDSAHDDVFWVPWNWELVDLDEIRASDKI